jgi:AcrR family transcriptional regulator
MRDLIVDEAVSLFAARGYGGSSMRELARRCGTTASNVYNYFPSKQDLLEEIFRRATEQIRDTIEAGQGDGPSDLEAYLLSVVSTVRAHQDLWRLIHQLRHDESVRDVMEETFGAYLRQVTAELGAYTGAPWLLLALVDGVAASIIQNLPLPEDDVLVPTLARAVRAAEPSPPTG